MGRPRKNPIKNNVKTNPCHVRRRDRRMTQWLKDQIEDGVHGISWSTSEKGEKCFKILWQHKSHENWNKESSTLMRNWAEYTGKLVIGDKPTDPTKWKANFRCALRVQKDLERMKGVERGEKAYRLYKLVQNVSENRSKKLLHELCERRQSSDSGISASDSGLELDFEEKGVQTIWNFDIPISGLSNVITSEPIRQLIDPPDFQKILEGDYNSESAFDTKYAEFIPSYGEEVKDEVEIEATHAEAIPHYGQEVQDSNLTALEPVRFEIISLGRQSLTDNAVDDQVVPMNVPNLDLLMKDII